MNKPIPTVEEVLAAIRETRQGLERADEFLKKVSQAGVKSPKFLGQIAESTQRLKEKLLVELDEYEKAYDRAIGQ